MKNDYEIIYTQEEEFPGRRIAEEYWADGEWHYKYIYKK